MAEEQNSVAQKRVREEDKLPDGGADGAGPAKKLKEDEGDASGLGDGLTDAAAAKGPAAGEAGPSKPEEDGTAEAATESSMEANQVADEPKKIGYKIFKDGKEAAFYFRSLVNASTQKQDLNEYEYHMVLELLKSGHPESDKKVGPGVRAIQVRKHQSEESTCFFLIRTDGSMEDFSVSKCLNRLFPAYAESRHTGDNFRGRGRGRGRGGGRNRGRGGRRGGRGRGRG